MSDRRKLEVDTPDGPLTVAVEQGPGDDSNGVVAPQQGAQGPPEPLPGTVWANAEGELVQIDVRSKTLLLAHWVRSGNGLTLPVEQFTTYFDYFGAKAPEPRFPLSTLDQALPYLRAPFTKEAVRFKVQTVFKEAKGCIIVGYIDARLVYERLNHVVGGNWHDDYEPLPNELMLCRLTVGGVTRQNVGSGYKGKGLYSDALKRTAVAFGVGVSVYALPQITLYDEAVTKGWLERYTTAKGPTLKLTDLGNAKLRDGYEKWLNETGIPQFGEPIDHGDVEDSAGEEPEAIAASADVSDLPAASMPLVDAKADELRTSCRQLYGVFSKLPKAKTRLAPAAFESQLASASKSHEDLSKYLNTLEGLKQELES